ncbi:MAG: N utilization substance protein NusB [Candidatus Abyssubacteria bacterium]
MGSRRKAREKALKILFQIDFNEVDVRAVLDEFWKEHPSGEKVREFTETLVKGAVANRERIDMMISSTLKNWSLERLNAVDRAILRCAVFELMYMPDIPPKVTINEAVEIAKAYGTDESGSFINGVLDNIRERVGKSTEAGFSKRADGRN